jgi:ribosome-interacting GTPase 1
MGVLERIAEIEDEVSKTQKNKKTEYHLGRLKAQLAKLRRELLDPVKSGGGSEGFAVTKYGNARVALVGFPSVGKSSLLSTLTSTNSKISEQEFTTLTCVPGNLRINDANIQILDLPVL